MATEILPSQPTYARISPTNPLLHFTGRWQDDISWYPGTGVHFKVSNSLSHFSIVFGPQTSSTVAIGVQLNRKGWTKFVVTEGTKEIYVKDLVGGNQIADGKDGATISVVVIGWEFNRIQIKDIVIDGDSTRLLPYNPSPLLFEFIGDSLTAGQYLSSEVLSSWAWHVADEYKAERNVIALPGVALSDVVSWGNLRGISKLYDCVQDSGFKFTATKELTPWTPADYKQEVSCIIINIGTNDNGRDDPAGPVPRGDLLQTYITFLAHLRFLYPHQPIVAMELWGRPNFGDKENPWTYFYPGMVTEAVNERKELGDKKIWVVDTKGWFTEDDWSKENGHPNDAGQRKAADHFIHWMKEHETDVGIKPAESW